MCYKALKGPHLADERQKMSKNSLKFEDLATGTLEQCYETDAKNARELLSTDVEVVQTRKGDAHDKLDVLEVATFCRSRKFISHRATQAVIEKDWRLDLNRVFKSNALIFLALFLPFIALPIRAIFYKRRSKDGKTSSRSTQDGPNYFVRLAHTITDFYTPPYIRFVQDAVSFAVLCVLFSVMVLVEYNQGEINKSTQEVFKFSLIEFLIMFWILALLVDEGGQVCLQSCCCVHTHSFCMYVCVCVRLPPLSLTRWLLFLAHTMLLHAPVWCLCAVLRNAKQQKQ
eukprot:m.206459 g.206459  ORF g.206459 m.206459 type:complete len:285 (-) comp15024_c0_seq5:90-944(-)